MAKLRALFRRVISPARWESHDRDLALELDAHLQMLTDDHIRAGASPQDAARQARIELGEMQCLKESCRDARGLPWLEELWRDLRHALRSLRQRPGFALIALLTLGLGTGATTVMFTLVNAVLLKSLPYPDADRLLVVHCRTQHFADTFGVTNFDFQEFKRQSTMLTAVAGWAFGGGTLSEPGPAQYVNSRGVSANIFSVVGLRLALGREFLPDEDRPGGTPVVIISERLWKKNLGADPGAIGKRVVFEGRSLTIVGVAPADFQAGGPVDIMTPIGQDTAPRMRNRDAYVVQVLARLRPGVTLAQAEAELSAIGRQLAVQYPRNNSGRSYQLHLLRQDVVGDIQPTLLLLLSAVSLVLLIASVNIASLLLARAVSRDREVAMRMALGARGARLARQCLTESAVLGLGGGLLGILIAAAGVRPFVLLWPAGLPRAAEVRVDWHVFAFALGIALLSSLLFGLAPALRTPVLDLEQTLRSASRSVAGNSHRLHSTFVGVQIALATVLLVSAGLLGQTMLRLSRLDPGLQAANVLTARATVSPFVLASPPQTRAAWGELLDAARRVPGVQSATLADIIPMRTGSNVLSYWTTPAVPPVNEQPAALASTVTPDYLKVMGIQLLSGRFFDDRDRIEAQPVVVIDDVMASHAFHGENAVGKRLWIQSLNPAPVTVIGVVRHVRQFGLSGDDDSELRQQFYSPFSQLPDSLLRFFSSVMSVAVRTSVPPLQVLEPLRHEIRGVAGDQVLYDINTMEQLTSASLARQRFLLTLFGIFAGIALLLACVGIYGVLAYLTSQRVPEIGVRMALGASAREVIRLVLRQSLGMILVGVAIGSAASFAAARVLARLVPGVKGIDAVTISLMTALLLAAALAASFVPARRASRIDPMRALRQE